MRGSTSGSGATETLETNSEKEVLDGSAEEAASCAAEEAGAAFGEEAGATFGGRTGAALTVPYVLVSGAAAAGCTAALDSACGAFPAGVLGYMTI